MNAAVLQRFVCRRRLTPSTCVHVRNPSIFYGKHNLYDHRTSRNVAETHWVSWTRIAYKQYHAKSTYAMSEVWQHQQQRVKNGFQCNRYAASSSSSSSIKCKTKNRRRNHIWVLFIVSSSTNSQFTFKKNPNWAHAPLSTSLLLLLLLWCRCEHQNHDAPFICTRRTRQGNEREKTNEEEPKRR